jgi:hypothetical protein
MDFVFQVCLTMFELPRLSRRFAVAVINTIMCRSGSQIRCTRYAYFRRPKAIATLTQRGGYLEASDA